MPIYEFTCEDCDENFEKLVRISGLSEVTCPNCGSERTKKRMSSFAARTEGSAWSSYGSSSSASSCSTGST